MDNSWAISNEGIELIISQVYSDKYKHFIKSSELTEWLLSPTPVGAIEKPLLMIKKIPIQSQDPKGLMIALFDARCMFSHLIDNDARYDLVINEDLKVLNPGASLPAELKSHITPETAQNENNQIITFHCDNKEWRAILYYSHYNHWIYVKTFPISTITKQARPIAKVTFAICFIMVLSITCTSKPRR